MKKIVLVGDSIRMGYEATVREELAGLADVHGVDGNGQHTVHLLLNFTIWIIQQKPDILHINAGLWDTRTVVRGVPGNTVPLHQYRENVGRLLALAKEHTKARVIWATTTPIDEVKNLAARAEKGLPGRIASDIPLYNAAAVAEARSAGVEVNDLYQFVIDQNPDTIRSDDGIHYTPEGSAALGRRVAAVLKKHL